MRLKKSTDPTLTVDQRSKEREYGEYVAEHRENVKKAWEIMKKTPACMKYLSDIVLQKSSAMSLDMLIMTLDSSIEVHDLSKYGTEEWDAYRANFYPVDEFEKESNKYLFDKAWEHHYTTNLHHWDWWAKNDKKDSMGLAYVVEMCCDWIAMSMKFGGTAYHWYKNQKDIILGDKQKEWTESLLKLYYNIEK